jgi:catechol 2,3-dioxygenase-like lactoylglutathione lyase family enzyme
LVVLRDKASSAIVAVSDMARARRFYADILGLEVAKEDNGPVMVFRTDQTHLVVYRSDEAGTNRANAVVWDVGGDFDAIVADLQSKGVTYERYPSMEGVELDGDVHRPGRRRWSGSRTRTATFSTSTPCLRQLDPESPKWP